MCGTQEIRDQFADSLVTKVQNWFEDQVVMDNENYIEGLLTSDELTARNEIRASCSNFMVEIFSDLSKNIKIEAA